jgi:glutamate-1-semialdehyde 2,1-aminomutase
VPSGDLAAVEDVIKRDPDIAAIILEPTGAHFGQLPFDVPDYLAGLRELTAQNGVILIFDEVVTGFRAAPGGIQERYGIRPDLTTMAKIVAGGLPGGAVGGKADIIDMIAHRNDPDWDSTHRVYHPGTFNGNPLSAAAGATALELIASQPINQQADAMAERLKAGLNEALGRLEIPGHAHGIASMIHVVLADCDCDREICTMSHAKIAETNGSAAVTAMKRGLQNRGVDIMGRETFLVSSTHTEKEIDHTLNAFQEAMTAVRADGLI